MLNKTPVILLLVSVLIQCKQPEPLLEMAQNVSFSSEKETNNETLDQKLHNYFEENSKLQYGEQSCPAINADLIEIGEALGYFKIAPEGYLILNPEGEYGDLLNSVSSRHSSLEPYCSVIKATGDIPPTARAFLFDEYKQFDFEDEEVQKIVLIHLMFVCF